MSAFAKEFLRTITRKPGRFLALMAIVALGAGFYAGLRMTAPDMNLALNGYLDSTNAYDIRVVSTLGLTDDDLEALREVEGVSQVTGAFECDAEAAMNGTDYTMRFHSMPDGLAEGDSSSINQLVLAEGEWPRKNYECVICADRVMDAPFSVGDTIVVNEHVGNARSFLEEREYTVVGLVRSPYYVSQVSLGTSSVGSGLIQQYVYVPASDFKRTVPYTEAFVTVEGAQDAFADGPEYWELVGRAKDNINAIADERERIRYDTLGSLSTMRFSDELPSYGGMLDVLEYRLDNPSSSLDDIDECEWLVMDRDKNTGMVSFTSDGERVDHIASVFPFVFFLVAALVALTTMTRMVDEERLLIGTYKALGYARGRITGKYVGYALLASGIGSIIGIAVLGQLLPAVIMNAYSIMYWVPASGYPLDVPLSLLSAGLSIAITLAATWFSVSHTLRERPAALLLPPAPSNGKRILLEHVTPLWNRLSFSWKVTCRNLFRYKKRFVMTLIGIAGCTALLLTGLGLHDAINDIIDVQYTEIVHHNAAITVDNKVDEDDQRAIDAVLADDSLVQSSTRAHVETMLSSGPRMTDKRTDLVVPEDEAAFAEMITLRTRVGHEPLQLQDGEVIINEKLAIDLGLSVGDTFTMAEQDAMGNATSTTYEFTVAGLSEIYIYNYVFANENTYKQATGQDPVYSAYYCNVTDDPAGRDELDDRLEAIDSVKTVAYNDETIETYRTMLRSVDLIVVVLVVSAAALAFIVLYNLTNINIEERVREIATLKVLGFTRRETNAYIFREVALLSIIGCLIGLAIGVPLENFVVTTAEVDQVMFGRSIHMASFVAGFVLTLLFSAASMLLMLPKLVRIDMVESLKSNE